MFQEIVQESQFFFDDKGEFICNDTARIIVGKHLPFLLNILNSSLFFYSVKHFYGGGILGEHGVRMKHTFFMNFPCIPYTEGIEQINGLTETIRLNTAICNAYGLNDDEANFISCENKEEENKEEKHNC